MSGRAATWTARSWLPSVRPASSCVDDLAVLGDQGALGAADLGAAERVEPGAAYPSHGDQGGEGRAEPRAEADLVLQAQRAEDRRVQAVLVAGTVAELRPYRLVKCRVQAEPGDLVLVLVGRELVQVLRDRPGEGLAAGDGGLAGPDALDEAGVVLRAGPVLERRQFADAQREHIGQVPLGWTGVLRRWTPPARSPTGPRGTPGCWRRPPRR